MPTLPEDHSAWTDCNGTFDPVEAGVALAALAQPIDEGTEPVEGLADFLSRESAYAEPVPSTSI